MVPLVTTSIYLKIWEIGETGTILTMLTMQWQESTVEEKKALFVIKILMSLVPLPQYKL